MDMDMLCAARRRGKEAGTGAALTFVATRTSPRARCGMVLAEIQRACVALPMALPMAMRQDAATALDQLIKWASGAGADLNKAASATLRLESALGAVSADVAARGGAADLAPARRAVKLLALEVRAAVAAELAAAEWALAWGDSLPGLRSADF